MLTKVSDHWIDLSRIEMVGPLEQDIGGDCYTIYMASGVKLERLEVITPREKLIQMINEAGPKFYLDRND